MTARTGAVSAFPMQVSSNMHDLSVIVEETEEMERHTAMDPSFMVEMAISIQLERTRVAEAMAARDAVVQRLANAYISIRQKSNTIDSFQNEIKELQKRLCSKDRFFATDCVCARTDSKATEEMRRFEATIKELHQEIQLLKDMKLRSREEEVAPPCYEEGSSRTPEISTPIRAELFRASAGMAGGIQDLAEDCFPSCDSESTFNALMKSSVAENQKTVVQESNDLDYKVVPPASRSEHTIQARYSILSALPLPSEISEDVLKPISIPAPFTFQELLSNTTGTLKTLLSKCHIFHEITTSWCPEREEHGYFLTPLFKCYTNPRVATAHCWKIVDPAAKMTKPTECFYNKDGKWYYAGVYKTLRLSDLTTSEWDNLSSETAQALIKETLAGRKNICPANIYETNQLYAAGALKIACMGVQCVGFNNVLYKAILEHGQKCTQSGSWKGWGLGQGVVWNSVANGNGHSDTVGDSCAKGLLENGTAENLKRDGGEIENRSPGWLGDV